MSFSYTAGYIGPFSVSVGRGRDSHIQRFRLPLPFNLEIARQSTFIVSGRLSLNWSTDASYCKELGPGGAFVEDAPPNRPIAVDEELTIKAIGDSAYVCVETIGVQQKVRMQRLIIEPGKTLQVPRYDLAIVADGDHVLYADGREYPGAPRILYGRTKAFELQSSRAVACALLTTA